MATIQKTVIICDRHGGEIDEKSGYLRLAVEPGKTTRGRKRREELELCESCAKDFLKFMEGEELKQLPTANQRVADGDI